MERHVLALGGISLLKFLYMVFLTLDTGGMGV